MDFGGSSSSHNYSQLLTETTLKKKKKDLKSQVFDDSEIKAHGLLVERGNLN